MYLVHSESCHLGQSPNLLPQLPGPGCKDTSRLAPQKTKDAYLVLPVEKLQVENFAEIVSTVDAELTAGALLVHGHKRLLQPLREEV